MIEMDDNPSNKLNYTLYIFVAIIVLCLLIAIGFAIAYFIEWIVNLTTGGPSNPNDPWEPNDPDDPRDPRKPRTSTVKFDKSQNFSGDEFYKHVVNVTGFNFVEKNSKNPGSLFFINNNAKLTFELDEDVNITSSLNFKVPQYCPNT